MKWYFILFISIMIALIFSISYSILEYRDIDQDIRDPGGVVIDTPDTPIEETERLESDIIEEDITESDEVKYILSELDITLIAQTLYGECRGVESDTQKAAVAWCILNRVDFENSSVLEVVTAPYQFIGYDPSHPVLPELRYIAEDVLLRWYEEKDGNDSVGRVLPPEFMWFAGDGAVNRFRNSFIWTHDTVYWDWSLTSPYED